jgi:CRISPR-associated protein Cas1
VIFDAFAGRRAPNAHLNYGYIILRSALVRSVIAAGLVPSLGVGHINARNNFCLVDDLVEPFRPLVDRLEWKIRHEWAGEITPEASAELAGMMAR